MHLNSILATIVIVAIISLVSAKDQPETSEPFKINKLNLVWTKAQHSLGPGKLKDLKNDLLKHEADELSLKKMRAHNQDKDGLVEASVRKKLLIIMTKYALERYYDDIHSSTIGTLDKSQKSKEDANKLPQFRDSKLDKLWKKAEKSGFSQEQLMILHEEFQHQQDKLNEHYETMNAIEDEIEKVKMSRNENSLDSDIEDSQKRKRNKVKNHETDSEKKARLDLNVHQGLKDKHQDIKRGYETLQEKLSTGIVNVERPFEEDVVNDLWASAMESNFGPLELESLKEELEHYEIRVKKLKHFQNQLERNKIGSKESSSYGEDDDEVKHIKRRVKDLSKKVEKARKSVENMLKNQRDEL